MALKLKKVLEAKNITVRVYAAVLGVSEKTAWNKINGLTPVTYPEVRITKKELLPEYDMDYLFSEEGENVV